MERQGMFKISKEERQMLLKYLQNRPYAEVFQLIALIVGLKPVENSKDKEKNKVQDDAPPFFDFTTLRSRTVQLLLGSIAIASVGMITPIFYLVSFNHYISETHMDLQNCNKVSTYTYCFFGLLKLIMWM